jgi:hypothetical protein
LGTTKATIDQVRNRSHWNTGNIKPVDPVTLGLVTQLELDGVVMKAAQKKAKDDARKGIVSDGPSLRPAAETGLVDPAAEARAAAAAAAANGEDEPAPTKHVSDKDVFSAGVFSDAEVGDED